MKKLFLIRHAKSSRKYPEIDDHEKPLSRRGERDCLLMARQFHYYDELPEVIYSSTATRAIDLAQAISDELMVTMVPDLSLYTFDQDELLEILKHIPNAADCVAVVGHNPALEYLINNLTQIELKKLPTSSVVALDCDIDDWADLRFGCAGITSFDKPKQLLKDR